MQKKLFSYNICEHEILFETCSLHLIRCVNQNALIYPPTIKQDIFLRSWDLNLCYA